MKKSTRKRRKISRLAKKAENDLIEWCKQRKFWWANTKKEIANPITYSEYGGKISDYWEEINGWRRKAIKKMLKKNRKLKRLIKEFGSTGLLDYTIWKNNDPKCCPTFVDVKSGEQPNIIPSQLKFLREFSKHKKIANFAVFRKIENEFYWIQLDFRKTNI